MMRMFNFLIVLAIAFAGCSDDDSTPPDAAETPDAAIPDAATPDAATPDAATPDDTRSGLISIHEVSYFDQEDLFGSGALVQIHYTEAPRATAPEFDTRQPDGTGCVAYRYQGTGGDKPALPPFVDVGDIDISGALSPIGTCTFTDARWGYGCIAAAGTPDPERALGEGKEEGWMEIAIQTTFEPKDLNGMWIEIRGANEPENNGRFPIIYSFENPTDKSELIVVAYNSDVTYESGLENVSWRLLYGAGPTNSAGPFLDDMTTLSVQKKADGNDVMAFSTDIGAAGEGFTLDDMTRAMFDDIALGTDPVTLACSGAGGTCGTATYTVVRGQATDGEVPETEFPMLPPALEDGTHIDFSCVSTEPDITIPGDVMALLPATTTRLQLTLSRSNAVTLTNADGGNPTRLLVGHGVIGTTTFKKP